MNSLQNGLLMTLHLVLPPSWPRQIKRQQAVIKHPANRIPLVSSRAKTWEVSATLLLLRPRTQPAQGSDGASGLVVEELKSFWRPAERVLLIPAWGCEETGIEGKGTVGYATSFWCCGYLTTFWFSELPGDTWCVMDHWESIEWDR